jgi:hypothetical protein
MRLPLARSVLVSLVLTAATSPPLFFITLHLQGVLGGSPTATGLGVHVGGRRGDRRRRGAADRQARCAAARPRR